MKAPRVRDQAGEIRSTSSILPPYLRRTKTLEALLPWLYLKETSTSEYGDRRSIGNQGWGNVVCPVRACTVSFPRNLVFHG